MGSLKDIEITKWILQTTLKKFRCDEYLDVLKEWDCLSSADIRKLENTQPLQKMNKTKFSEGVTNIFIKTNKPRSYIGLLDLIYGHRHSKGRTWMVYKLQKCKGASHQAFLPDQLETNLKENLDVYFNTEVNVKKVDGAFWMRLYINDSRVFVPGNVFYLVYFPHAEVLITTSIKVAYFNYILQAFYKVLSCDKAEKLALKGKCVKSLAQLAINCNNKATISQFKLNAASDNPLCNRIQRKRKAEEDELDDHIVFEQMPEKKRKEKNITDTFGTGELPVLEKVEYKLETMFHGCDVVPSMAASKEMFHCSVKFEGPSVIQGLKNMGAAGLASFPMKNYVGKLQTMGRNVFLFKQKKSANTSHHISQG